MPQSYCESSLLPAETIQEKPHVKLNKISGDDIYSLGEKPNIELDNISGDDILNKGQQYVINMGFLRK